MAKSSESVWLKSAVAEKRAQRRWSGKAPSERSDFEKKFKAGGTPLQLYLARKWAEYEKHFPRDANYGSRKDWQKIRGQVKKLLVNLEKINGAFGFELQGLRQVAAEARLECQPKYRLAKLTDRRRIFWVSAVLPYLVYETGEEQWDWIATFVGLIEGEAPGKDNLMSAWKGIVKRMMERYPPRPPLKEIPNYPPVAYAPFDYAEAYLLMLGPSGMSKQKRSDYIAIVDKQIPFLSYF